MTENDVPRCAVYIDGLNFYHSAVRKTPSRWLDIVEFARLLALPGRVARVLYVTGRLTGGDTSDGDSHVRQREYLKALSARGGVEVVIHNFVVPTKPRVVSQGQSWAERTHPSLPADLVRRLDAIDDASQEKRRVRVRLPEEKMTDVALSVAMVNDYHLGICDRSILVANDSDYRPALETLGGFDHNVHVVSPAETVSKHIRNDKLWSAEALDRAILGSCQLPNVVVAADGREFKKPKAWY